MQTKAMTHTQLGAYLIEKNLITKEVLDNSLKEQKVTGDKLGNILIKNGFINRKTLLDTIVQINPDNIQGEKHFSATVPSRILESLKTMIVMENPNKIYLSTLLDEEQVRADLQPYYGPKKELVFIGASHEDINDYVDDAVNLEHGENSLFERIVRHSITNGMSDIHIIPKTESFSIFLRKNGVRFLEHEGSLEEYNAFSARIKDMAGIDIAERRIPQDGAITFRFDGKLVDLRVATVPTVTSEYIVMRILDPEKSQPSLNNLGITNIHKWRQGISRPDGLCLICGPTGSGKTTTLNASIKEMDRFGKAIFTMEDPVEYQIAYVGQVSANPSVGLDFAKGVRAFMRADPDVLIIGEVRDLETARNAVKAAETGHLVIATMHTGSIYGAISRLRDLGVPQHELTYLIRSILVQRLIRTSCQECHGEGCDACQHTGYTGRSIVSECEYFSNEMDVENLIAQKKWWKSMFEDALEKQENGMTTQKELIRVFGAEAENYFINAQSSKNALLLEGSNKNNVTEIELKTKD